MHRLLYELTANQNSELKRNSTGEQLRCIKGLWCAMLRRILISDVGTMKASFFTLEISTLSYPATPHPDHPLLKHTYLVSKGTTCSLIL